MARSEAELIEAARGGDTKAMEELLAMHERQIYRFGLRMCGSEDDAREVLQETLLAAFKNLRAFRGDSAISTWLYQIARSYCIKSRRRTQGEPERVEPLDAPEVRAMAAEGSGPETKAHAREVGEVLQVAIGALPETHREVIVLRDVEGLSAEEAASVLGIEVGALKSRLHRARMDLRGRIAPLLEGGLAGGEACPELSAELTAYAAAEVDQATCARIEEHLGRCPRCAGACEALKRTVSLCKQIPGGDVPAPVRAAVRQALRQIAT